MDDKKKIWTTGKNKLKPKEFWIKGDECVKQWKVRKNSLVLKRILIERKVGNALRWFKIVEL